MADDDLQALVDSLDGASSDSISNAISNFSLDMLQRASALIGSQEPHSGALLINLTKKEEQCNQQARLEEHLNYTATRSKLVSVVPNYHDVCTFNERHLRVTYY